MVMDGRTWSLSEVPEFLDQLIAPCPIISERWPDPPAVVKQHFLPQRSFVVLSAQVRFSLLCMNLYDQQLS